MFNNDLKSMLNLLNYCGLLIDQLEQKEILLKTSYIILFYNSYTYMYIYETPKKCLLIWILIFGSVTSLWTTMSVCRLVCLSVQKKIFLLNFEMSEFSVNVVFLYFFLKSPPHPYPCFNMKRGEKIILKEFKSYLFH